MNYIIKQVQGHVEVYDNHGLFVFSADTWQEAYEELEHQGAA